MQLDTPSLMLTLGSGYLLFAWELILVRRRLPTDRALRLWTKGSILLLAGMVALLARVWLPEWPSVLAGNALVLGSMWYFNRAVYLFIGPQPVPRWVTWLVRGSILALPVMLFWPISTRSMVLSCVMTLLAGSMALHVFRHGWHAESTLRAVGLTALLLSLAHLLRAVQAGLVPEQYADFFQSSMGQGLVILLTFLALLGSGVGFVMACLERTAKSMEFLAGHDALTGCLNRRSFDPLRDHAVLRAQRTGEPMALLLLDLDHFKRINDVHGHRGGDHVLHSFAQHVRARLRSADVFARLGGEEFAVLLPGSDEAGVLKVAKHLCDAVADTPVVLPDGQAVALSVSIGIALLAPRRDGAAMAAQRGRATVEPVTPDVLYMRADQALYEAKQQGRKRVVLWREERLAAPNDGIPAGG